MRHLVFNFVFKLKAFINDFFNKFPVDEKIFLNHYNYFLEVNTS